MNFAIKNTGKFSKKCFWPSYGIANFKYKAIMNISGYMKVNIFFEILRPFLIAKLIKN